MPQNLPSLAPDVTSRRASGHCVREQVAARRPGLRAAGPATRARHLRPRARAPSFRSGRCEADVEVPLNTMVAPSRDSSGDDCASSFNRADDEALRRHWHCRPAAREERRHNRCRALLRAPPSRTRSIAAAGARLFNPFERRILADVETFPDTSSAGGGLLHRSR